MRGIITLAFDDGYASVFEKVVPQLTKRGLPGVFAIPLKPQETFAQPLTSWQQWLTLASAGHEIAAHSVGHKNLTYLSPTELEQELKEPHRALNATTLVYPGGAYDATVTKAAATYYRSGRTVERGFETVPPRVPLQLHSFDFTRDNFSVTKANMLALWAWLTNRWLIETYHLIDDELPTTHSVRLHDFCRHLDFIKRLPVAVRTIQDVTKSL